MVRYRSRTIGAALAVGAIVALPGIASAHPGLAVSTVQAHTDKADAALARASALFAVGKDAKATVAFTQSRAQTAAGVSEAAKLVHSAGTPAKRAAAAKALRVVATDQDAQIPAIVGLLGPADAAAENPIAAAALANTKGRDKAVGILQALLAKGVLSGAKTGIGRAIVALATDRTAEVNVEANVAASADVSPKTAATLATTIDVNLRGQARAAAILTTLKGRLPAAAAAGIDRALAALAAEQGSASATLKAAAPGMPEPVQSIVDQAADNAAARAAQIRAQLPTPPVPADPGAPQTPAGPPAQTPPAPAQGH